jgi:signal peptidase II
MKKMRLIYCAASIVILVFLDQITKLLAVKYLISKPVDLIPGVFQLYYLENRGAAFGLFQNQKILFIISTVIIVGIIFFLYLKIPEGKRYRPMRIISIGLMAGAIGNFIDRILRNYVVDFLYFKLIDFPVFNVADCYVTISCIAMLILFLFYYKEEDLQFLTGKKKTEES